MSSANRTIVGIISSVGGGTIPPVIALAEGLRARHHQVVFVCDGGSSAQVSARGFQTITIPDGHQMSAFFGPTKIAEWNGMLQAGETIDYVANPFSAFGEAAAREVIEYVRSISPRFIFSDLFTMGLADELSSALDVPWCYVNPAFVDTEGRMRPVNEDYLDSVPRKIRNDWLPPLIGRADLVIHATDREYDPVTNAFPSNHYQVGPLNLTSEMPVPDYLLNNGAPWALISTSTSPFASEEQLVIHALSALADKPVRAVATAPKMSNRFVDIPNNARVEEFAPHDEIMRRACLVVSHAGHGAVMRALVHGVPMVLVPQGKDQAGVSFRAERLGVAVVINRKDLSQKSMDSAIDRVLTDKAIRRRSLDVASRLASEDPLGTACDLVEATAGTGTG